MAQISRSVRFLHKAEAARPMESYPVWCNKAEVGESAKQGRCKWLLPQ